MFSLSRSVCVCAFLISCHSSLDGLAMLIFYMFAGKTWQYRFREQIQGRINKHKVT